MRFLSILVISGLLVGCGAGVGGNAPLNEEECGQLLDKMNEIFAKGFKGEELEEWNADHYATRDEEVAECVADPAWGRKGFECVMKANSKGGLDMCIMRNR